MVTGTDLNKLVENYYNYLMKRKKKKIKCLMLGGMSNTEEDKIILNSNNPSDNGDIKTFNKIENNKTNK